MIIDNFDIDILTVLQTEGRISNRELADRVHLSPTPCWTRKRKLEEHGFIIGYHADINYQRLNQCCYITTFVSLENTQPIDLRRFEKKVLGIPEIVECERVCGDIDYILKFIVSSLEHYQKIYEKSLEIDNKITQCTTYFRSKKIKKKFMALPKKNTNSQAVAQSDNEKEYA